MSEIGRTRLLALLVSRDEDGDLALEDVQVAGLPEPLCATCGGRGRVATKGHDEDGLSSMRCPTCNGRLSDVEAAREEWPFLLEEDLPEGREWKVVACLVWTRDYWGEYDMHVDVEAVEVLA